MSDSDERVFHYYREIGGRRERWRFVLDKKNTFLRDERVSGGTALDLGNVTTDAPEEQRRDQSAQIALLQQRGFEFEIGPQGNIIVTKAPELEMEISKFFTTSVPCFFPECEKLRAEWKTIIDRSGGEACSDCEKGRLMNQFRSKLEIPLKRYLTELHGTAATRKG